MNGIEFGKELKKLRNKAGVQSKELANRVGKAVTYVSQLERGLIKKPDFDTCVRLLEELGITQDKGSVMLEYYGILSPERELFQLERAIEEAGQAWNFDWLEQSTMKLKQCNNLLHTRFNVLIEKDISKAEKLINNIEVLTTSKERFEFLCTLFEYDYSIMTVNDRKELSDIVCRFILSRYGVDEYGEFVRKENEND